MPNSPSIDKCPCLEVQGRASQKSVGHKSVQFVRDTTNGHGPEKSPLFPARPSPPAVHHVQERPSAGVKELETTAETEQVESHTGKDHSPQRPESSIRSAQ